MLEKSNAPESVDLDELQMKTNILFIMAKRALERYGRTQEVDDEEMQKFTELNDHIKERVLFIVDQPDKFKSKEDLVKILTITAKISEIKNMFVQTLLISFASEIKDLP